MNELYAVFARESHAALMLMPRLVLALVIILVSWLVGVLAGRLLGRLLRGAALKNLHQAFFRSVATALIVFIGLVLALNVLGLQQLAMSLLAGGGVTAIVLGFAFREIGENFLAGLFLAFSRPFAIGDIILSGGLEGEVRTIELRYSHIRTADGRDIYIPSAQLLNAPVTNFTRDGLRRLDFTIGIDYRDDALAACALLRDVAAKSPGVLGDPVADAHISSFESQWVLLQVQFWVNLFDKSHSTGAVRDAAMDGCRRALLDGGYVINAGITSGKSG